ncbi:unnamed protein product [Prorocentrum cordatum]|uniref:Uncharacterized protein n=1 Tax=Prorocentrum cordatum TaxID=2364126 RepID=A0ABN9SBL1_9DINO|nr:unnamed protein product [Polarella glacialis]
MSPSTSESPVAPMSVRHDAQHRARGRAGRDGGEEWRRTDGTRGGMHAAVQKIAWTSHGRDHSEKPAPAPRGRRRVPDAAEESGRRQGQRAGPSACSAAGQPRQGEEEVSSRRGARGATRAEPAAKRSGDLRRVLGRRGPHATCTAFAGAGHCASGPAVVPGLSHRGCLPAVPI